MMIGKEKIQLTEVQETLLIPLYSKAQNNPFFDDPKARQILEMVQYDFKRLKIPQKTEVTLRIRAKQLDAYTAQFIQGHPNALILHLGCGLDSRCERVTRLQTKWIDLDLPDVIELRRKFYPESDNYRLIGSSVSELSWVDRVDPQGRPVFIVAEGLLMYLKPEDVRALIVCLHERFPGCHLAFDAFSRLTAEKVGAHPSLQKTGAVVRWGIDDPHEIETWADGIRLKEEWFFSQSADLEKLSGFYRFAFRLSARIPAAQKAQRLLYYIL